MSVRARRGGLRWRWRILAAVVLLPLALAGSAALWLLSSLPQTTGRLAVPGLAAAVRITRDASGVPHIAAANERDAAFALGFVHAQDRLFQMDMMRRLGAGRLSELIGPATLGIDRTMRTLGLYRLAERQYALLSPPLRAALDAYAAGVNAFLAQRRALPPEYYMLRATPEEWRPADSLVWGKYMALLLAGNYRSELLRAELLTRLTPEQLAQLYPQYPGDGPVTIGNLAALYRTLPLEKMYAALPDAVGPTFASNNWVLAGGHTASGKPLLANDPHLDFSTPDIWYLARIDTPELHLAGATAPGTPFLVIGHNERIGWGFTTTGGDVEDVFVERVDPNDPNSYLTPQGSAKFTTRQEQILVRGEAPVTLTVRATRHGPVISDIVGTNAAAPPGDVLALQATFLAEDDLTPQALWDMNHAHDWTNFNEALRNFTAPEQNIVYADVDGTIAFTAPARIPIRGKGDGWLPAPGWTGDYDWTGFLPFEDLPRQVNPPDGRFVSANNKIVPDSYPHFITRDWDDPYRAQRITELLGATPTQSPDTTAAIQADTMSLMARQLLPLMLAAKPADARETAALELLRNWDGRMDAGQAAPLVFTAWLREANRALFAHRLGNAFAAYWNLRPRVVSEILRYHREWCGGDAAQPSTETCGALLAQSLGRALDALSATYGDDMSGWRWGRAHIATFAHPIFSHVPVLGDAIANEIPADGGQDTVNAGAMPIANSDHPFRDVHGPGLRMILDFDDLDDSRFMAVPGESGNPLSRHYGDLLHRWHDFNWLHLGKEATGDTLVLLPR